MKDGWAKFVRQASALYDVGGGPSRVVPMEGLRGLAVLLVFFVHLQALFGSYAAGNAPLSRLSAFLGYVGNSGVDLFFLLSGYLIYGALIRRPANYGQFLQRRVERIYPTFLFVLAVYLVLSALLPSENKIHGTLPQVGALVVANLFLLPGFFNVTPIIAVAWSLSFEFVFYLLAPLIVAVSGMRAWRFRYRFALIVAAWLGFAVAMYSFHGNHIRMISFISGALLYEVVKNGSVTRWLGSVGEWVAVLAVVLSFAFYFAVQTIAVHPAYLWLLPVMGLSVAFFLLTLYACEHQGRLAAVFSWTPMRFLGNMSYSYYLIHGLTLKGVAMAFAIAFGVAASTKLYLLALVLGFAATWISSTILFWLIEKRFSLQPKLRSIKVTPTLRATEELITPQPAVVDAAAVPVESASTLKSSGAAG